MTHTTTSPSTRRRGGLLAVAGCPLVAVLSVACAGAADPPPADAELGVIGSRDEALYAQSSRLWLGQRHSPYTRIEVCLEDTTYAEHDADLDRTRLALSRSWASYSFVRFFGWQPCHSDSSGIRLRMATSAAEPPHTVGLGVGSEVTLNPRLIQSNVFDWGAPCFGLTRNECWDLVAIHEFGHALGFAHEQDRPEGWYDDCSSRGSTPADLVLTTYDDDSIMSRQYCGMIPSTDLSAKDRDGIRAAYGGPWHLIQYGSYVAIRSQAHGGRYLAEDGKNIVAGARTVDRDALFELVYPSDPSYRGWVPFQGEFGLRTRSGRYVRAYRDKADGFWKVDTQSWLGPWERWHFVDVDDPNRPGQGSVIGVNAPVGIANRWGRYLQAHRNGDARQQTFIGSWEEFRVLGPFPSPGACSTVRHSTGLLGVRICP